jgi:hypothetical protein
MIFEVNKNLPEDFENWSKADLDSPLRCFYADVRRASGELYKRTSLFSIRNGINRYLSKTYNFLMSECSIPSL